MPNLERAMVYKSNSLVEACYRLSVIEQRIVLACVSQVRRDEPITDEIMYSVSAQDIAELSETNSRTACRDLQEGALRLKRREVRIEKEANGNTKRKQVLICGWVQSIMYIENEGRVCLRFNKDMLPYLTELSAQFTKYRLKAVAKMDSSYAIRLYELLNQWRDIHEREVSVQWLRDTFQLGDKYPAIKDLKKWVVDPAVAQINEHSDLTASYVQRKTGRNVTHLTFSFRPKEEPKPKKAKTARTPKTATTGALDAGRAKMEALVIEFLTGNESYNRRYPNIPHDQAWHVEAIRNEYLAEFDAWRGNRP
jgi:plasmid replication initiation protein